jgi:transcriptional regulator with XRE-family HTH domain
MDVNDQGQVELCDVSEHVTAMNYRKRCAAGIDRLVGARLRLIRESARVSRRDMAAGLDMSVQQLSKYEMGANRMSVGFLYQAALFLRVPVQDLLVPVENRAALPASLLRPDEEEEAVLRFVTRNIRSIGTRKRLANFLADLLRAPAEDGAGTRALGFNARTPVAGD